MKKEFYAYEGRMVIQTDSGLFICDAPQNGDYLLKFALVAGNASKLVIPNEVKISNPRGLNIIEVAEFELESPRNAYFVKEGVLYGNYKINPADKEEIATTALIAYPRGKTSSLIILPDEVSAIYQKSSASSSYTGLEKNPYLNVIIGNLEIPKLTHGQKIGKNATFLNKETLLKNTVVNEDENVVILDEKTTKILKTNFLEDDFLKINYDIKNYVAYQKSKDSENNFSLKENKKEDF